MTKQPFHRPCPVCQTNLIVDSAMCRDCRTDQRRSVIPIQPKSDTGSYAPKNGRYGLLCVWGYPASGGGNRTQMVQFLIYDNANQGHIVESEMVNADLFARTRHNVMQRIRTLNNRDARSVRDGI